MSEQKEELMKLIEHCTEKTVVLHIKNGEVYWLDQPLAGVCQKLVSESKPDFTFESEESPYGKYLNEVFFFKGGAVIYTVWQAAEGYSRQENKITVLKWETP